MQSKKIDHHGDTEDTEAKKISVEQVLLSLAVSDSFLRFLRVSVVHSFRPQAGRPSVVGALDLPGLIQQGLGQFGHVRVLPEGQLLVAIHVFLWDRMRADDHR